MAEPRIATAADANALAPATIGGKAANLAALTRAGFPAPPWFCVTTAVFRTVIAGLQTEIDRRLAAVDFEHRGAVEAASRAVRDLFARVRLDERDHSAVLERFDVLFPRDAFVSVRSSAVGEDSAKDSFAGQMDSYLYVTRDRLEEQILACFGSAFSARSLLYRQLRGLDPGAVQAAAVVQLMVESRVSGILFTANPTSGDRGETVVSAGLGLGEGVVGDLVESDTYFLDGETGAVRERNVAAKRSRVAFDRGRGGGTLLVEVKPEVGDRPALTDTELGLLGGAGRRIEAARGAPQDIEWAIDGSGTLHILQTRPITTLAAVERETVFDNANVVESYPGLSLPLTFSFARRAYELSFREASRRLGTSEADIQANRAVHENLVALVDGRIYYNIGNWYRIFEMLPGLEGAIPAWEQALGLRKRFARAPRRPSLLMRLRRLPGVIGVRRRMLVRFGMLDHDVRRFHEQFYALYHDFKRADLAALDAHALLDFYERLAAIVMPGYGVSIVNDFFTQQLYALVGKLAERYGLGDANSLRNGLLCGETGMESVEPVRSILALTELIRGDARLRALFEEGPGEAAVFERVREDAAFAGFCARLDRHLDLYGDRTLHELKLETPLMADDPAFLASMFRNYLRGGQDVGALEKREKEIRDRAESAVRTALAGHPIRRAVFRFALRNSRKTVRHRESLRLLRSRAFGIVKRIFREIGRLFAERKQIDAAGDVFWLGVEEVTGTIRGSAITRDLRALVALRKREYEEFRGRNPDTRIVAKGIVYAKGNEFEARRPEGKEARRQEGELRGVGCSSGKVAAKAKVILSPEQDMRIEGEVLVAPMTDPGWVFLMVAAGGIVSEKGSLLSHTAIIGRELGIPTVVGVKDATKLIQNGAEVEIDGQAGVVRLTGRA